MHSHPYFRSLISAMAICMAGLGARTAFARQCSSTPDCPLGFECLSGATSGGGGQVGSCVSISCRSDADCGPGLRCDLNSPWTTCVTGPDGGQYCSSVACVPAWVAPCSADSDCGAGFSCSGAGGYDQTVCGSSWDASLPAYAHATAVACPTLPVPAPNSCGGGPVTCFSVAWKTCVAQTTAPCSADSDCPSTWTCGCKAPCGGSSGGIGAYSDAGPSTVEAGCTKACVPPNSDLAPLQCGGLLGGGGGFANASADASPVLSSPVPSTEVEGGAGSGSPQRAMPSAAPSANRGCQIGEGDSGGWTACLLAALACVSARRLAKRRRHQTAMCS
jgi:hypothetical protein